MTPDQLEAFDHAAYAYRASAHNPRSTGADELAALVAHVEALIATEVAAERESIAAEADRLRLEWVVKYPQTREYDAARTSALGYIADWVRARAQK